jgi:hypothetical protein
MRMYSSTAFRARTAAVATVALGLLGTSGNALAGDCTALPAPIYVIGASSMSPIFQKIGTALSGLTTPQTLVYQSGGSCSGVDAITMNTGITGNATYWDSTGTQQTCTFAVSQPLDVATSDVQASSCPNAMALPAGTVDQKVLAQSFVFVVPKASSATAISAQAGYFLFGFPNNGSTTYPVGSWTIPKNVITRNSSSGTAILMALALGVPLADLTDTTVFTDGKSGSGVISAVAGSTAPQSTIGIAQTSGAQTAPAGTITMLAYQHYDQQCGWTPSSTPSSTDLINVRNGHYAIWGYEHFYAPAPLTPAATAFLGWFSGSITAPGGLDINAIIAQTGGVIDCAMEVQRSSDMGPLASYAPDHPCGCFFEKNATGATACQTCQMNSDCPANAPNCTLGYCEAN